MMEKVLWSAEQTVEIDKTKRSTLALQDNNYNFSATALSCVVWILLFVLVAVA
jgi:hypothetical protein